jgi:hypothetical protein
MLVGLAVKELITGVLAAFTVTVTVAVVEPGLLAAVSVYVVVAAGLTLVEPLAKVEVNVPGVIAMLATPVVVQLRVLLAPELISVGFAAKELIAGIDCGPFPVGDVDAPQLARPAQVRRTSATMPCFGAWASRPRTKELRQHLSFDEFISFHHSNADAGTTVALCGRSPLGHIPQVHGGHAGVVRACTNVATCCRGGRFAGSQQERLIGCLLASGLPSRTCLSRPRVTSSLPGLRRRSAPVRLRLSRGINKQEPNPVMPT